MSETLRRVASPRGRAFLDTWVIGRGRSQGRLPAEGSAPVGPPDRRPVAAEPPSPVVQRTRSQGDLPASDSGRIVLPQPDAMPAVRAAIAKAQMLFDAAERVLQASSLPPAVAQAKVTYDTASAQLDVDVLANDDQQAMQGLALKQQAAQRVLDENARAEAARRKQEQFDKQKALFDELAPTLDEVKRTYLNPGGSDRIAKEKLSPGRHFQTYLDAMQQAEAGRSATPRNVQDAKQKCETMVAAAQAYLVHFESDLSALQKKDKANLRKKQLCEEGLVTARQFALAMELDAIGAPNPNQPWDEETEIRAGGLRAAMYFEQGYQQAKSLKDSGEAGKSASYWVQSASIQPGRDERGRPTVTMVRNKRGEAIFKPADGETPPDVLMGEPQGVGAAKEMLASANARLFASMTGIDLGVPDTTVAAVGAYAVAGADPNGPPLVGSVQQHAGATKMLNDLPLNALETIRPAQVQKIALVDIMSLSVDRHAGNLMVDDSDPANLKLIPIDHGATLPTPEQFETASRHFAGLITGMGQVAVQNALLGIPAAYENFNPETVAKLQRLDPAAMEQGMLAQRDALDRVHPGLDAGNKVDDQSFALSKRSMMFLKRAASVLSPAEIQLAIAQNSAELVNAADNQFNAVADRVIAEMAPKKAGYKEIFLLSDEHKSEIVKWLNNNNWGDIDFLMRDPVTALKIYKAQTPNTKTTTPFDYPKAADEPPDDATKQAILARFPGSATAKTPADRWKKIAESWLIFQKRGPASYDAAVAATRAPGVGTVGEAIAVQARWQELMDLWTALRVPQNAVGARITPASGSETIVDVLDRMIVEETKALISARAQDLLAQTDDQSLHTASARARLAQSDQIIRTIANQTLAASLTAQSAAVQATLAQGDAAKADDDAAALLTKAYNLARDETNQAAQRIKADLMKHELSNTQIADLNSLVDDVRRYSKLAPAQADLAKLQQFAASVMASLPAAVQLPGFAWSQANASAVKKQAVTAGLFKDQDTGMSAALGKVLEAREKVAAVKGKDFSTQRELLRDIIASYNGFGDFIDAKLRGLSGNPGWQAYCDDAAAKVKAEIDKLLQAITLLEKNAATAAPRVVLPAFTWDPANATAVKKQAVKAGLFKDQETGMTAELAKIAPVRAQLAQANSLSLGARRTLLKNGSDAYKEFGRFVAGKLRGLSRDPSWARYCDSAADQVKQETDKLQQQLAAMG